MSQLMTQLKNLPLYSSSYTYTKEIYCIKLKLPKSLKHDLGQEVFGSTLKILRCIVLANRAQEKTPHLSRLLLETEVQWAMIRLLFDLRGITEGEFAVLSEHLSSIEKQTHAWLKWQQSGQPPRKTSSSEKKTSWQLSEKGIT
jgi:hypothetical protein